MSLGGLELKAALLGSFDRELAGGLERVAYASRSAMHEQAEAAKSALRADVNASRMRNAAKLANTWRSKEYANNGIDPAAVISSNAPLIISAFERGAEIVTRSGKWLAIPNPDLRIRLPKRRNGRSIVAAYEARYGKLRMIRPRRRNDLALMVTDLRRGRGARGGFRRVTYAARRRGDYEETVVLFLVPKAKAPKLLRGEVLRQRLTHDFPPKYQRAFERHLAQAEAHAGRDIDGDVTIALGGSVGLSSAQQARVDAGLPANAFAGVTW